jgi:RNA polymerase sigma-70 factor (ECF subfamily)
MALRHMKNREDAEEVTQDVLLKVCRKIDRFRGDAALSSWIYRITFNTAMSRLREFKQNLPLAPEKATDEAEERKVLREVRDTSPLADEEFLRTEMRKALVHALKDMPLLYRAPVMLRDVQGLTTEEASAVLGVKEQTLKSRLHRGRLMLREELADFSTGLSLH